MSESIRSTPNKSPKRAFNPNEVFRQDSSAQLNNSKSNQQQSVKNATHKKQSASTVFQNNSIEKSLAPNTVEELDFYRSRCVDQERQIQMLLQEQQMSQRESTIYESKMDTFKENSVLQLDNEKLVKLVLHKKTETELWKQKYENQLSHVIQVKANYEQEIRQLQGDNQKLIQKVESQEFDIQKKVLDSRGKIESANNKNLDDAKKTYNQQADIFSNQVRLLRDQLEEKNLEIDDLSEKLLRTKREDDEEIKRVLKENESLRNRLNQFEIEKQQDLEELTNKIGQFQEQQLLNFKFSQSSQNMMIESEVEKVKGLLDLKNTEIQTLIVQNQKIKCSYEDTIEWQRKELNLLKSKLLDSEKSNRKRLETLSSDLNKMHQEDIDQLRVSYENQIMLLEKEMADLKDILLKRDHELQQQFDEKLQLSDYLESQINFLKNEIEQSKARYYEMEREKRREIDELQEQFMKNQSLTSENTDQKRNQIKFLEEEMIKIKEFSYQKSKELESLIQQSSLSRKALEDDLLKLRLENERLKEDLAQNDQKKSYEQNEIMQKSSRSESTNREKIRQLEICCEHQDAEIKRLKEQLDVKGQEIDSLLVMRTTLERELRRVKDESEQLRTKIIQQEREKKLKLSSSDELKVKLENSSQYQIQHLKAAFNTQISILHDENSTLKSLIEKKNNELEDLIDKQLVDKLSKALNGAGDIGAEVQANKYQADAFIKSRSKLGISRQS